MSALMNNVTENFLGLEVYIAANEHLPEWLTRITAIIYFCLGTCLNGLLIYYLIRSGKWRSPTFTLITSLATGDMVCCASVAVWAAALLPTFILPMQLSIVCGILMFTGLMGMVTSGYHLLFFAALRYYQLTRPLAARARVTPTFVLKGCAIVWIFSSLYMIPYGVLYKVKHVWMSGKEENVCVLHGSYFITNMCYFVFFSATPSISISILHIAKYFVVNKSQHAVESQQERRNTDARAVSIVIILFIITWFPANSYSVAKGSLQGEFNLMQDRAYLICLWIVGSNSAINPLIYCIAAKSIRDDIIKVVCGRSVGNAKG